jgi:DNA-binding MarR family transcriptional regulator
VSQALFPLLSGTIWIFRDPEEAFGRSLPVSSWEGREMVSSPDTKEENQSTPLLTSQQHRILRLLHAGDLIWEIADDPRHCTVYNEKRGRDQHVPAAVVTTLEQQGWIRRRPNPQADRLDSWELTPEGGALAVRPFGIRSGS